MLGHGSVIYGQLRFWFYDVILGYVICGFCMVIFDNAVLCDGKVSLDVMRFCIGKVRLGCVSQCIGYVM